MREALFETGASGAIFLRSNNLFIGENSGVINKFEEML